MNYKLKKISGDASFREFYRLQKGRHTSIIVQAKKEKFKNLITYIVVNNILKKNKIYAPKLITNHYDNNIIEISDLGNKSFYEFIIKKKSKFNNYKNLIRIIIKLQNIKPKRTYHFGKYKINFQNYSIKNLHKESDLFFDWYLQHCLKSSKQKKIKNILKKELTKVYKKLYFKNTVFVHRDFHASNIMVNKNKLGLIDSQDAIIGNPLYDVASLIDDVRFKTSKKLKKQVFEFYLNINKKELNLQKFKNDFDILSVLRNLKIIGIFTRLAKRDKKYNYLKFIPYTWKLIELRISDNFLLEDLKNFLDKNFSIKIRNKNGN